MKRKKRNKTKFRIVQGGKNEPLKLKGWICELCRNECALDVVNCPKCDGVFPILNQGLVEFTFDGDGTPEEQAALVNDFFGFEVSQFGFDDESGKLIHASLPGDKNG
jgi:hypothetical protein